MKKLLLFFFVIPPAIAAQVRPVFEEVRVSFLDSLPSLLPLFVVIALVVAGGVWFVRKLRG